MAESEVDKAQQLVRDVILAQSNVFIKELLLKKNIRGGATKADFQEQLDNAVADSTLTYAELKEWIDETEGWGDEHIYLYKVLEPLGRSWSDEKRVEEKVCKAGLGDVWNADTSLEFPAQRRLTGVYFADGELTCVWHHGGRYKKPAAHKDFDEIDKEDGEHYFYTAKREFARRDVARVVVRPASSLAAVFLPSLSEPKTHTADRESMAKDIEKLLSLNAWELYSMGEAIKTLDAASMRARAQTTPRARNTRLSARGGGYVEFASDTDESYASVESLREVRNAVSPGKFKGMSGNFQFLLPSTVKEKEKQQKQEKEKERAVKVQLYGDYDRIRMWVRLTRNDVWWILSKIPKKVR